VASYRNSSRYGLTSGGILATRKQKQVVNYYQYISKDNDSFESIASKTFGDGLRYWEIADVNPQVKWPDRIPVGTVLRIPL
jgi:nucleoid-associated protein YgaU